MTARGGLLVCRRISGELGLFRRIEKTPRLVMQSATPLFAAMIAEEGAGLQEIDAGANACSVEWCPIAGLESYVACSTYLLESPDADTAAAAAAAGQEKLAEEGPGQGEEAHAGGVQGQTRSGSIVVHKLSFNPPPPPSSSTATCTDGDGDVEDARQSRSCACLKDAARVSLDGGVLDAKWCHQPLALASSGAALLACATSTGRLGLYTLSATDADADADAHDDAGEGVGQCAQLQHLCSSNAEDSLLLSLDWSGGRVGDAKIVVSQSDGALAIWRPHPNGGAPVQEVAPWHAHTLRGGIPTEAWISFFRRHGSGSGCEGADEAGGSFVVSGADDALMKGWDLRVGGGACGASPAFVCKEHGAGVTAGQWHPTLEHTFVSGSYDESVRIWDARALRTPVSTTPTGGGLWRLKWHPDPDRGNLLLAACMHAGMRVLHTGVGAGTEGGTVDGGDEGIVAKFTRHASMAYGADWCRLPPSLRKQRAVIASCSFYDSLLCLWETPPL